MEISLGNDAAVSEFGAFVSDTCTESFPSECPLRGLLFSSKVLIFGVEKASFGVVSGVLAAILATGKAITARRMFGRVWIRYCTILEREESRSAAQTRASQYALSLTETVMFLMGSPSGGTKRFPGLPSIYDCPRMEGNYLQNLAARLVGKERVHLGFAVSQVSETRPGPPAENPDLGHPANKNADGKVRVLMIGIDPFETEPRETSAG